MSLHKLFGAAIALLGVFSFSYSYGFGIEMKSPGIGHEEFEVVRKMMLMFVGLLLIFKQPISRSFLFILAAFSFVMNIYSNEHIVYVLLNQWSETSFIAFLTQGFEFINLIFFSLFLVTLGFSKELMKELEINQFGKIAIPIWISILVLFGHIFFNLVFVNVVHLYYELRYSMSQNYTVSSQLDLLIRVLFVILFSLSMLFSFSRRKIASVFLSGFLILYAVVHFYMLYSAKLRFEPFVENILFMCVNMILPIAVALFLFFWNEKSSQQEFEIYDSLVE